MKTFSKLSTTAALIMVAILSGCTPYDGSTKMPPATNFQSPYTNDMYPPGTVINGYTLPPEPDHEENDKTLLGIDTNHNDIRDDIERYIIIYEHEHPSWSERLSTYVVLERAKGIQKYFATGDIIPTEKIASCDQGIDTYARKHGLKFTSKSRYAPANLSYNTQPRSNKGFQLTVDDIEYHNRENTIDSYPGDMRYCPKDPFSFGELPQ